MQNVYMAINYIFILSHFLFHLKVNMNDRFGDVMLNNLRSRRCSLAGVDACQTLDTQTER